MRFDIREAAYLDRVELLVCVPSPNWPFPLYPHAGLSRLLLRLRCEDDPAEITVTPRDRLLG